MKKVLLLLPLMLIASACESELTEPYDVGQKPANIMVKGYSSPDAVELRLNNEPVIIGDNSFYTENIETTVQFVIDKGETNMLEVYNHETGEALAEFPITYDNIEENSEIYFFNLPGIFLNTYAVKPTVNLGRMGFVFLFPNLGEFSGTELESVKGILKRANGTVLATFEEIGKENFTDVQIYNFFSATEPVYLELYKPGTTEPYTGTQPVTVTLNQYYINNDRVNMIVLQEKFENGTLVIKGDIDIADYLQERQRFLDKLEMTGRFHHYGRMTEGSSATVGITKKASCHFDQSGVKRNEVEKSLGYESRRFLDKLEMTGRFHHYGRNDRGFFCYY